MSDDRVLRSLVRDDAYHVERVLAKGPSGTTELVTLDGEGPLVRKRIPAELANASAWATVMGLEEPLLPQVEEIYRMPDELVVVCTYVLGDTLRERMAACGRLEPALAVRVMGDLCHAAGVLHAHGIVHRDITPGNVVLADDGAHLIDLGIARRDTREAARDTHVLGTWGFAAPEQFGFAQTDARSDVYALGRLLGYMLVGIRPDDPAFEEALADEQLIDPALAAVVRRATAFEPGARYQQACDLADELVAVFSEPRQAPDATRLPTEPATTDAAAATPRPLKDAPVLARAVADLCWLLCLVWNIIIVFTGINEARDGFPHWQGAQYVLAAATVVAADAIAYEAYCAITHRGWYAHHEARLGHMLRRMGQVLLFMLLAFGLEVLILALL